MSKINILDAIKKVEDNVSSFTNKQLNLFKAKIDYEISKRYLESDKNRKE